LIVIAMVGILAAVVLPDGTPALDEQLRLAAQVLKTDLAYARSLAITHQSTYRITFEKAENRYVLTHSGADDALDALPDSPFRNPDDPPEQHVVDFDELPRVGRGVRFEAAMLDDVLPVDRVEYNDLGELSEGGDTSIWLAAGEGKERKYIQLKVYAVTGLAEVGGYTTDGPRSMTQPVAAPSN
jgi:hypothetical protein